MSSPKHVYVGALSSEEMAMLGSLSQLSSAVAVASPVTAVLASVAQSASRNTSASAGPEMDGAEGAVSSFTVMSWSQLMLSEFPQWSVAVAVNVRVKE